jgi:PAS domain S-box-containing protein
VSCISSRLESARRMMKRLSDPTFLLADRSRELEGRIRSRNFSRRVRLDGSSTLAQHFNAVMEALERSVTKADGLIESARDGIVLLNAQDLTVVKANPAAEILFGRSRDGLIGQPVSALIATDELSPDGAQPLSPADLLDGAVWMTWGIQADGARFPMEITVSHLSDEDGDYRTAFLRDMSERVRAQQELNQTHEWQQRILDAIPFPVAVMRRRDEVVLYVNQPVAELAGCPVGQLVGRRSSVKYVDRRHYDEVHALLEAEGRADAREVRLRNGDGHAFWAILSAVRIDYGSEDAVLIGFTDITARIEAETAQRELIDSIPVPLVLARTSDASMIQINRRAAELFGIATYRAVGRKALDFYVRPEERERLSQQLREDGQVDEFEVQLKDDYGRPFWALLSARLFNHQGEAASLTAVNVINERKRMEEELARERTLLMATLENMDQAMLITDGEMRVIGWNQRCIALLDLPEVFLKGGPTLNDISTLLGDRGEFAELDPADAELFRNDPRTLLETRRSSSGAGPTAP